MIKNFKKNNNGFTLIELIVVMIIIGILVLLAIPRFIRYIEEARYTRIINDIRVVETVSMPEMVKNNMEFPKGTEEEETDLSTLAQEKRAYMKDGIIVEKGVSTEFTPEVGNISEFGPDDIRTGYHKLDKKGFIKPETKTRLKGDFYINKEGYVVYVDGKAGKGETTTKEEFVDRTGLFFYDDRHGNPGTIIGVNFNHEYFRGSKNKINLDYLEAVQYGEKRLAKNPYPDETYKLPQIPDIRIMEDGREIKVEKIENLIINPNNLNKTLKIDKLVFGDNMKEIGNNAFKHTKYLNNINEATKEELSSQAQYSLIVIEDLRDTNRVEKIGEGAFEYITLEGKFDARNIKTIGKKAFFSSIFTGDFDPKGIEVIGDYGLARSKFTGDFDAKNLKSIGMSGLTGSKFTGDFDAKNIESLGNRAFQSSEFSGSFDSKGITEIGNYAFYESKFTEDFLANEKLEIIGDFAFYESKFTGDFYSNNIKKIGRDAFNSSRFGERLILGDELVSIGGNTFFNSNFKGEFNPARLKNIGGYAFYSSKFIGELPINNNLGEKIIIHPNAFGSGCFKE